MMLAVMRCISSHPGQECPLSTFCELGTVVSLWREGLRKILGAVVFDRLMNFRVCLL